jgi:hypothetical protein
LYFVIEPSKWKSFVGIKSRTRKEQKLEMVQYVKKKYNLDVPEDIADSIGINLYVVNALLPKIKTQGEQN